MGGFFSLLASWFLGAFTRLFGLMVANVVATKVILGTLFIIILPIIINNILYELMETVFASVTSFAGDHAPDMPSVITFSGLAGYLASQLGVIDAMSVVLSAMGIRFAMSWIPFVGPK